MKAGQYRHQPIRRVHIPKERRHDSADRRSRRSRTRSCRARCATCWRPSTSRTSWTARTVSGPDAARTTRSARCNGVVERGRSELHRGGRHRVLLRQHRPQDADGDAPRPDRRRDADEARREVPACRHPRRGERSRHRPRERPKGRACRRCSGTCTCTTSSTCGSNARSDRSSGGAVRSSGTRTTSCCASSTRTTRRTCGASSKQRFRSFGLTLHPKKTRSFVFQPPGKGAEEGARPSTFSASRCTGSGREVGTVAGGMQDSRCAPQAGDQGRHRLVPDVIGTSRSRSSTERSCASWNGHSTTSA